MSAKDVQPTEPTDDEGSTEAGELDAEAPVKNADDRKVQRKTGLFKWSDRNLKTGIVEITW